MAFSRSRADAAINFFERVLKHTADEYYGKPFYLAPWQAELVELVYGTVNEAGNRIIEIVYAEVPKKTGKTELAAGLVLLELVTAENPGCQVYGAAAAVRQAQNVFRASCKMVEQSSLLRRELRILRSTNRIVSRRDPESFYAAVAADGDLGDGVNPKFTVMDEVHRLKTRKQLENWDVLVNGGITRKQTLTWAITTAGVRAESPLCWSLHEKALKLKAGLITDPKFLGRVYAADPEDSDGDPRTWIKAIPSLRENGGFLDIAKIREKYEAAVNGGDLRAFRRYFLNKWDQKDDRCIEMTKWDASGGEWRFVGLQPKARGYLKIHDTVNKQEYAVRVFPEEFISRFRGRTCYIGVDLSMTTDLSAVVCVFPCEDESFDVLPFFWLPSEDLAKRQRRDGMPYEEWSEQGLIELAEGSVIDYKAIKARLVWCAKEFNYKLFCFDPYNSRDLSSELINEGYRCADIGQGFLHLNAPTKKVLELVVSGRLHHGNNSVLRSHASACSLKENNDNVMFRKPERSKETARIDGMAALVTAMNQAMLAAKKRTAYAERGIRVL